MKQTVYTTILLCGSLTVGAQGLSMPDADPQPREVSQSPTEEQAQPPVAEAKYNTPSQSYKDERNAIRSGNSLFNSDKYHEALQAYEKALQVNSGSIRARYNKAVTLLQLQSDDNKGTANDPRMLAGQLLESLIDDARSYDPEIAEKSYYNLGNMAFNDQQYDRSIELYKSALRINPDNLATRENLRLAQLKKQEQENQDQQ
ncbi:MAG: tetratricopeptide repeat protein, partial [Muribaculaceae bacterium]|nr:tetratricopeptide repeat protein [Muribaculaceae bacterium]